MPHRHPVSEARCGAGEMNRLLVQLLCLGLRPGCADLLRAFA